MFRPWIVRRMKALRFMALASVLVVVSNGTANLSDDVGRRQGGGIIRAVECFHTLTVRATSGTQRGLVAALR
jgi:hypothetical protein